MAGLADAADELEALAFRLRRAGDGELVQAVTKAMRDAVVPVEDEIRAGLDARLPDRYAAELNSDLRIGTSVRTAGSDPGVSVTGQTISGRGRKLRDLDGGIIHHPLFGDREHWYKQEGGPGEGPGMHSGWFTAPAEAAGPRVRAGIERALADVASRVEGR
jgi:hypothetical protein